MAAKVKCHIPHTHRKIPRRWTAAEGGNRLSLLHQLLVADRNHVDSLPEADPRRRPSVARVRFLERASS